MKKHIRSYVLRQGRMTPAQTRALDELWTIYGIEPNQPITITSPTVLEIGFGTGSSLAYQAKHNPHINFIGIEVHKPGVGSLLQQLKKEEISNIKIISHDAVEILQNFIPDASLEKIQLFFPDPWPKKKHHKRRIIQADFVKLVHQKLIPQGILHIATDWENYAEHITEVILASNLFESINLSHDRPETKFECRGKKLGHGVWDLIFRSMPNR